eukprot:TRINITY_DN459_c0_g3_i2.p1 TRINITY_DN459_c0_g3~~TRINITY_DN459_c0_g3_i2.p1  ORF type:complete len:1056 (-),score=308.06 TRINITY_DN459_c0_g3_i2:222-3335(-)
MESIRQCHTDLERYLYLRELREKNEQLYFRVVVNNAQEVMPFVYTPTVGEACEKYSKLPLKSKGLFITPADKGKILEKLKTWPEKNVRVTVVTDGERILGLGDLGYGGMGISEGKIILYTVIAGVDPNVCLPVCLDVGTNNKKLLEEPLYKGIRQERLRGQEYDELVDEFMSALRVWQPHMLLQFEDFGNANAFRLLEKYRSQQCCFNDDIQGTACIALAGLLSALRITKKPLKEQTVLFLGAGEAGVGIGHLIAEAMVAKGGIATMEEAMGRCFYVDSKGLVCKSRTDLQHHKLLFAHDVPFQSDLLSAVKALRPTMLIGVSTQTGAFNEAVIKTMAEINERPIVFPLSNPTSKAECTYKQAFEWTGGRVVFASGSPFPALKAPGGKMMYPAQANNAYVFGPIGMAAILTKCKQITDGIFLETAFRLAELTPQDNLESGLLFPTFSSFKRLVVPLIAGTMEYIVKAGLGKAPAGAKALEEVVRENTFNPATFKSSAAAHPPSSPLPSPASDAEAAARKRSKTISVPPVPVPEVHEEEMTELLQLREMYTDLQRYLFLRYLQAKEPKSFWKLTMNNAQEILPFVYTPTVGEACQKYSRLPIQTRGIFITPDDRGRVLEKLKTWPEQNIRIVVVTDGERILGLGDLGYGGMGISEGKIMLYTVIGGVDPCLCLPVCIDVGTNNQALLADPMYKGLKQPRLRGEAYDALVDEFMSTLREWQPHMLLQFEDFGNVNAFRLLEKYRRLQCCFNDDIQGTACIVLAGLLSALRVTGQQLKEQIILFFGAGEAGVGIGKLICRSIFQRGGATSMEEAHKKCFYIDSKGLVCESRTNLQHHKLPFAHDVPFQPDLLSAIKALRPTVLIGVSTQAGAFSPQVLDAMAEINERPVVFPLSNPTSKAECTFVDAFEHTNGRVVFASGSPFPPYTTHDEKTIFPAQANNAYVFGPIGMAALLTRSKAITDDVFIVTAEALAAKTPESRLSSGMLFPTFSDMKFVAPELIADLVSFMVKEGLGSWPEDVTSSSSHEETVAYVKKAMFQP